MKDQCPSERKSRDLTAFLATITAIAARRQDAGPAPRRPPFRGRGRAPPGRNAARVIPSWYKTANRRPQAKEAHGYYDSDEDDEPWAEEAEGGHGPTPNPVEPTAQTPVESTKPSSSKPAAMSVETDAGQEHTPQEGVWTDLGAGFVEVASGSSDPYMCMECETVENAAEQEEAAEREAPTKPTRAKAKSQGGFCGAGALFAVLSIVIGLVTAWPLGAMITLGLATNVGAMRLPIHAAVSPGYIMPPDGPLRALGAASVLKESFWKARGFEIKSAESANVQWYKSAVSCNLWTVDSGCTGGHVTNADDDVNGDFVYMPPIKVRVASGQLEQVKKIGNSLQVVKERQSGLLVTVALTKVMLVPPLVNRLLSVRHALHGDGILTYFNHDPKLVVPCSKDPSRVFTVSLESHPSKYKVKMWPAGPTAEARSRGAGNPLDAADLLEVTQDGIGITADDQLTHNRFMHVGERRIRSAGRALNIPELGDYRHDSSKCKACLLGGAKAIPWKRNPRAATQGKREYTFFGERVGSDLCGPFPASRPHGFRYALVFYDYHSGKIKVYFLREKSGVLAGLKQFVSDHKGMLKDGRVWQWHTDNGGEFVSNEIDDFCAEISVNRSMSIPYLPPSNGGSERAWGLLLRPMRIAAAAAGHDGDCPFWPFLMMQAESIHNSLPSRKFDPPQSPNRVCNDPNPIPLEKLKAMLCKCYVKLNELDREHKLSPTGIEAMHLGYDVRRRGYFVYIPALNRLTTAYHVKFDEGHFMPPTPGNPVVYYHTERDMPAPANVFQQEAPKITPAAPMKRLAVVQAVPSSENPNLPVVNAIPLPSHTAAEASTSPAGPSRHRLRLKAEQRMSDMGKSFSSRSGMIGGTYQNTPSSLVEVMSAETDAGPIPLPRSAIEALSGPWAKEWRAAMDEDVRGKMVDNQGWKVLARSSVPKGRHVLKGKWVFEIKYNDDGSVRRFKARWVACGYTQVYGKDYEETALGTLSGITLRTLFAKAALLNLPIRNIDAVKAFTTTEIDREIYIEQPHGYGKEDEVCVMLKALEGTKQAGYLFYVKNAETMRKLGAKRCTADPCLYRIEYADGWIDVGMWVDDGAALASSDEIFNRFKGAYGKHQAVTGGDLTYKFIGITCERGRDGSYKLHQKPYIEAVHAKYLSKTDRPRSTPVDTGYDGAKKFMNLKGAETEAEKTACAGKDYLGLMGCLSWIADMTRPDIRFHVSFCGQFMSSPSIECYDALLTVLSYIFKTRDLGITYERGVGLDETLNAKPPLDANALRNDHGLTVWSDASWGTSKSHGGHVIMFGGAAVGWTARRIKVIALSSTEGELCAGIAAVKDIIFIRQILTFLNMKPHGPTPLLIDNEGMWHIIRNEVTKARTKHFALWQDFVRECYKRLYFSPRLISTDEERADILTKAITKDNQNYKRFRNLIMNVKE